MSYNTELQNNNEDLRQILNEINALPEAGSVESPEVNLQDKTVTPTKSEQVVTPDYGYDGLETVTVEPIPDKYIDTSDATAEEANVLSMKTFYANGVKKTGAMVSNGAINKTLDGIHTKSVTIPSGHTTGGTVSLTDDIDNEVDTQTALIRQISSVLDSKSGASDGSVSVETCVLSIDSNFDWSNIVIIYTNSTGSLERIEYAPTSLTVAKDSMLYVEARHLYADYGANIELLSSVDYMSDIDERGCYTLIIHADDVLILENPEFGFGDEL